MRRRRVAALGALAALALAGCGGGDGRPTLRVSAAASLKPAFEPYGAAFAPARAAFSFAGSDELAAQIRQGAAPDVFAAASPTLPAALHAEGLVARPVAFATNRLVIAVPSDGARRAIARVADLAAPGVRLAVGAPGVPVGAYTRRALARLGPDLARRILANVRTNEPDVGGVAGKVALGAVDAGIVYITDVRAARGRLRAIELPAASRPRVVYAAAVVRGARHPGAARAFLAGLRRGAGRRALAAAGFGAAP